MVVSHDVAVALVPSIDPAKSNWKRYQIYFIILLICAPLTFIRSLKNVAVPSAIAFASVIILVIFCVSDCVTKII